MAQAASASALASVQALVSASVQVQAAPARAVRRAEVQRIVLHKSRPLRPR